MGYQQSITLHSLPPATLGLILVNFLTLLVLRSSTSESERNSGRWQAKRRQARIARKQRVTQRRPKWQQARRHLRMPRQKPQKLSNGRRVLRTTARLMPQLRSKPKPRERRQRKTL